SKLIPYLIVSKHLVKKRNNEDKTLSVLNLKSTANDEMCNYYIMFYTNSSVADSSGDCKFNELTPLTGDNFPKDVSVPLPPNPALEEAAIGSHNHPGVNPPEQNN
ncbi:alpha-amidating enzyme precursor 2, partial [Biomphalaria glabrata]